MFGSPLRLFGHLSFVRSEAPFVGLAFGCGTAFWLKLVEGASLFGDLKKTNPFGLEPCRWLYCRNAMWLLDDAPLDGLVARHTRRCTPVRLLGVHPLKTDERLDVLLAAHGRISWVRRKGAPVLFDRPRTAPKSPIRSVSGALIFYQLLEYSSFWAIWRSNVLFRTGLAHPSPFIVQPSIGSSRVKHAPLEVTRRASSGTALVPAGDAEVRYAPLWLPHQGREWSRPSVDRRKNMSHTLIPKSEIEDLSEEALQSKFSDLRNDLLRAEGMRTMALASLQTVQTELHIKRALRSRFPKPGC